MEPSSVLYCKVNPWARDADVEAMGAFHGVHMQRAMLSLMTTKRIVFIASF